MKYYLTIGERGTPTLVYSDDNEDNWDKSGFKFIAEIDRVSAITISRVIMKYAENCIKNRDPNALNMTPYIVPYDFMKTNGDLDVRTLDNDVKSGVIILTDNLLYK